MNWFKTMWLNSEEREALRKAKEPIKYYPPPLTNEDLNILNGKPYKNIFYTNRNLTVVFRDGTVLSKSDVPVEIFQQVRDSEDQGDIEFLLSQKDQPESTESVVETRDERVLVASNLDIFRENSDFVVKGEEVYLKGVNLAMPAPVIASFIELLEKYANTKDEADLYLEQIQALKMFWLKLALNTLPQSREDLLVFVRKNDVRITKNGNLILYRRIVTKAGTDTKLVTFVSQEYYRLKKQGADTRMFAVGKVGDDYELVSLLGADGSGPVDTSNLIGNLQVMYLELPTFDTNAFTSAHDDRVEIKIGGIYKIPDDKINLNNGLCAAGGLHAAAVDYDYSGFGDLPVVVLVNPSKAITVPMNETGKLRTTEMFIACVNDKPMRTHFDESALSAFDSEYHDLTLAELEDAAKSKSFSRLSVQNTVPAISLVDLNTIRDMLKNRIKNVI